MPPVELPEVGSRWIYPKWNNAEWMGPWRVMTLGVYDEEDGGPCIVLRRDAEPRHIHHELIAFWPGGWEPAD
jgi:hypothetical protein